MRPSIDLNADVGEEHGDDAALLSLVTSANLATGAHAGGGDVLESTMTLAIAAGCAVGAHPSYPDREGFGRRRPPMTSTAEELVDEITAQVVIVGRSAHRAGASLRHVKAHGALYHDATDDPAVARCFVDGVVQAALRLGLRPLPIVGLPDCELERVARDRDVPYVREAFADRAYDGRGRLVPRSSPGAVLDSIDAIAARVVAIALNRSVRSIDGEVVTLEVDTICLHGDTPGAVSAARAAREALARVGVQVAAPAVVS